MTGDRPGRGPIAGWPWLPDLAPAPATIAGRPATPSCADELVRLFGSRPGTAWPHPHEAHGRTAGGAWPAPPGRFRSPGSGGATDTAGPRAERQPGGWACASACWLADDELAATADRYLGPDERAQCDRLDDHGRRSWLAGRIAVKDAVSWWLADRGEDVGPAQVVVATDTAGRPYLRSRGSAAAPYLASLDLRLSVAHQFGVGVAIVAQGRPVGIRIEELAGGPPPPAAGPSAPVLGPGPCAAAPSRAGLPGLSDPPDVSGLSGLPADSGEVLAACAREAAARCRASGSRSGGSRPVTALGPDLYQVDDQLVRCVVLDPDRFCSQAGHPLVVGWTVTGEELDVRPDPRPAGIV